MKSECVRGRGRTRCGLNMLMFPSQNVAVFVQYVMTLAVQCDGCQEKEKDGLRKITASGQHNFFHRVKPGYTFETLIGYITQVDNVMPPSICCIVYIHILTKATSICEVG